MPVKCQTPNQVRRMEVIQVWCARGAGTAEDPVRTVVQYWDDEGHLLAERDPIDGQGVGGMEAHVAPPERETPK